MNKKSKNFQASLIKERGKTRDFIAPLDWLTEAGVVCRSYQVKEKVSYPLMADDDYNYRLYPADTGFFTLQSNIEMTTFIDSKAQNTLSGIFLKTMLLMNLSQKVSRYSSGEGKTILNLNSSVSLPGR